MAGSAFQRRKLAIYVQKYRRVYSVLLRCNNSWRCIVFHLRIYLMRKQPLCKKNRKKIGARKIAENIVQTLPNFIKACMQEIAVLRRSDLISSDQDRIPGFSNTYVILLSAVLLFHAMRQLSVGLKACCVNSVCLPKFQAWNDGSKGLYSLVRYV